MNLTLSNGTVIVKGLPCLHKISNIKNSDTGSPPVRVCVCTDGQPGCSYQPNPMPIQKGRLTKVPISLAVLDQVERPVEKATLRSVKDWDQANFTIFSHKVVRMVH